MGAYINPVGQSKENWLKENGTETTPPKSFNAVPEHLAVCLINNGAFTAAGIAFNDRELQEFLRPDGRPKMWYWAPKDKLMDPDVSSLHNYLKD